jgi:hypothetical protein
MAKADSVHSTPRITASKNTPPGCADQTILSDVRTIDGASEVAITIPAIDPTADRRSDSRREVANTSAIAPPARTSRRGFLMNTMVSAASLATAAAVAAPSIANATPAAVSFPDLVARFLPLRERWKSETTTSGELDKICSQLTRIATAIVNQPPKSLCDLGWQVEAFLTWADDFETIDDDDDSADRMLKKLLANVRSLGGPLPIIPGIVPAPEIADPIFAAIEAHRTALADHSAAVQIENDLEETLPHDKCCSKLTLWEEEIVETDDPRWPAAQRCRMDASNTMDDLAIDLLNIKPTTVAGIEALLRYFADQEEGLFPQRIINEDESVEAFGASLIRTAADALREIARPSPA